MHPFCDLSVVPFLQTSLGGNKDLRTIRKGVGARCALHTLKSMRKKKENTNAQNQTLLKRTTTKSRFVFLSECSREVSDSRSCTYQIVLNSYRTYQAGEKEVLQQEVGLSHVYHIEYRHDKRIVSRSAQVDGSPRAARGYRLSLTGFCVLGKEWVYCRIKKMWCARVGSRSLVPPLFFSELWSFS